MSAAETVLEVSALTTKIVLEQGAVIYPVRDVSLTVRRGETLCLVGESGSGKSLLSLSIMRVLPPGASIVAGHVSLDGEELTRLPERQMRQIRGSRIAMVPQDPMTAFDPLLPVGAQIEETIRAHQTLPRQAVRGRTLEVLGAVGLPNPERVTHALPGQLSGGMNQRALIAMALATEPTVLLADEPTTALDVTVQAQVLELLLQIQRDRGLAIVLITHDMGVAAMVADRIAVMYAGRVVEQGEKTAVFAEPRHPYTVGLINAARESMSPGSAYYSIPGTPPNLLALPPGCAFEPRCAYAREGCHAEPPPLRRLGAVDAACLLDDDERPWLRAREAAHA